MPVQNSPYPSPYDAGKADEIWACLSKTEANIEKTANKQLLQAIAGNSPFLGVIMEKNPALAVSLLSGVFDPHITELLSSLKEARPKGETIEELMAFLRQKKSQLSLITATADIARVWSLGEVTSALSLFADGALELSVAHLVHEQMTAGALPWPNGKPEPVSPNLSRKTGYFILGMGKLGAYELNYSSDIDLIVLYDPAKTTYSGRKTLSQCFIKLTQMLVQIMDKRTMHGYVFRTDLRLRPDPGATPVAIAIDAAESYYHSMAVNWERSAMIKARVVAGDKDSGEQYLKNIASWVWRRNMDFNALRDVAAIKNMINRHYDQKNKIEPGYNVKLGFGGIREIEFFAQVNQLLHAGRHPFLRLRGTLDALSALQDLSIVARTDGESLAAAYRFLRKLEHRLQMVNDAQTHELPMQEEDLKRIALFMGHQETKELLEQISYHTQVVSTLYDRLMPDEDLTDQPEFAEKNLYESLVKMGFNDCEKAVDIIESWRRGRYRALRTERAKTLLEQCLPGLLEAFCGTENPVSALIRFDKFLSQLPQGVQLFSLMQATPSLFQLLARIMGLAPALADTLSKKPELWDMVLEPHFFMPLEDPDILRQELDTLLDTARDFQDVLDIVRRYVAEQKFRCGVHLMESIAGVKETGEALTRLTDVTLQALIPLVSREITAKHGIFPGGGIAVLAMGKYGGAELTHTSDIDIVFLYHCEDMKALSDGEKPLAPSQYFSRLCQHIITAISALTPEGRLFEVDTRLRPSGSKGPLVVTLKTFEDYYAKSAWTWEHMALTRARVIMAPDQMKKPLADAVSKVLTTSRDKGDLVKAVAEMRTKLFSQFGMDSIWAIKHCRGGLVDMEFICQYLMLREGHKYPTLFEPQLSKSIDQISAHGFLDKTETTLLHSAHEIMQTVQSLLRLCVGSAPGSSEEIPKGLREILVQSTEPATFEQLENTLQEKQEAIYNLYNKLIEEPAKLLE